MLNIQPFLTTWAYPLLALLLAGGSMWLMAKSGAWLTAHAGFLSATTRQKILGLENEAIQAGVEVAISQAKAAGATIHPSIDNPVIRYAANVALNHASGILQDNGATPDEVAAKILAKLPDAVVSTDTTGQTVKTGIVTIQTLSPAVPDDQAYGSGTAHAGKA